MEASPLVQPSSTIVDAEAEAVMNLRADDGAKITCSFSILCASVELPAKRV